MAQTQPNLLELAKQGNAKAIAALMNRQLQPKGITAKAALKDGCLQIMLESAQVPNQQALVAFIRKGITGLGAIAIETVKVYGRQTGEEFPGWSQEIDLGIQARLTSPLTNSPLSRPVEIVQKVNSSLNSTSAEALVEQSKVASKSPLDNQDIENTAKVLTSDNSLDRLDICSLIFMGLYGVSILSNLGIFTFIFMALIAMIPAHIAKRKGRKFIRWYCWGFLMFFIALIFVILIGNTKETQNNKKLKTQIQISKLEEENKAYLLLLDPVNSPIKNLQTNLAQAALDEFRKVQARVDIGVSYNDLPAVLAPAKLAVQNFERSKDYGVSTHLSYLTREIMFFYELSQQIIQVKVNTISQPFAYPSFGGIGIPTTSVLGKLIQQKLPEFPEKYIGFGNSCYEFDITIQTIWLKASKVSDKLQEILEVA